MELDIAAKKRRLKVLLCLEKDFGRLPTDKSILDDLISKKYLNRPSLINSFIVRRNLIEYFEFGYFLCVQNQTLAEAMLDELSQNNPSFYIDLLLKLMKIHMKRNQVIRAQELFAQFARCYHPQWHEDPLLTPKIAKTMSLLLELGQQPRILTNSITMCNIADAISKLAISSVGRDLFCNDQTRNLLFLFGKQRCILQNSIAMNNIAAASYT